MMSIDAVHGDTLRRDLPAFRAGDTVRVHVKIKEGDKERIQIFEGVVIQRRGGGHNASFTVRKISSGVGVERIFPIQSPNVAKVEIKSRGHVRRAKLFYLRELSGKKARLRAKVRDVAALNVLEGAENEAGTAAEALPDPEPAPDVEAEEAPATGAEDASEEAPATGVEDASEEAPATGVEDASEEAPATGAEDASEEAPATGAEDAVAEAGAAEKD